MAMGCTGAREGVADGSSGMTVPESAMQRIYGWSVPDLSDDLPLEGLLEAVRGSMEFYEGQDRNLAYRFGKDLYKASELKTSLQNFITLMEQTGYQDERRKLIKDRFHLYRAGDKQKKVLFTGYFEPVLYGSRLPGIDSMVPVYGVPSDLITVDLSKFMPEEKGKRLIGRYQGGTLVPYYTRYEIDRLGILSGRGYEIAWVQDPVEAFFLQVQGSGKIIFPDGSVVHVHYAANNGRPYRSIGELLTRTGKIPGEQMSMHALKAYLKAHPEELERTLDYNQRYVFFEEVPTGPLGSTGVPLTPERSLATDPKVYPPGALVYVETEVPVLGDDGMPARWQRIQRFVLNQDAGGAIRGPGRADLFWGSGETAGQVAGWMNRAGNMYFLAPKQP